MELLGPTWTCPWELRMLWSKGLQEIETRKGGGLVGAFIR